MQPRVFLVCGFEIVPVGEAGFGLYLEPVERKFGLYLEPEKKKYGLYLEPAEEWAGGLLVLQSKIDIHLRKARWPRFFLFFALLPALAALSSCGGSSSTASTPTITVTASATTVSVNGTVQFTATITNLSSTLVNWQVNGVLGGNLATDGSIDSNGKYTAPATAPTNNVVVITAVAQAQTSLTATANLTIQPPATITGVTPNNATVAAGGQQAFTATFSSGTGNGVNWFINNSPTCSSTRGFPNGLVVVNGQNAFPYGQMSNQGNYIAPLIPPAGGAIALTAVSQADPNQSLCVTVNLAFGNASLQGNYAFSTSGRVISTNAFFARAGRFTAGSGALTGGLETYNEVGQGGATSHNFLGTYNIGADGRGTMAFCEDTGASSCTPGAATVFFRVAVISAQQVQLVEYSPPSSSVAQRTASGRMISQDTSVFNQAGMTGAYSFDFSGILTGTTPLSMAGEFSSDGRGAISTSIVSTIPGIMDINNGGITTQAQISGTSTYSINANGQGAATVLTNDPTFPNLAFTIYIVSASRAVFIESDGNAVLLGDAFKQQTNSCTWGTTSLNGLTILETSGRGAGGEVTDLISFTANGTGTAAAGTNDENNAGTVTSGNSLAGTYNIDSTAGSCGRGTLSLGSPASHTYAFYMISPSSAVLLETSAGVVGHGLLIQPQSGSVALQALNSFALNVSGTNAAGSSAKREDLVGQLNVGSTGSLVANLGGSFGSLDINNSDPANPGVTQTVALTSGTLTAGSRSTLVLNSAGSARNFVVYFVSPAQPGQPARLFVMGTDSTGVAVGSLYQQF